MAYSADSFVADEVPTTAKWNKLWTNDASFNDGTGFAAGAIGAASRSEVIKSGTLTVSSTGNKAVTGVGFQPKAVLFFVAQSFSVASNANAGVSIGVMDASGQRESDSIVRVGNGAANHSSTSTILQLYSVAGGGGSETINLSMTKVSLDSDGFTVNVGSCAVGGPYSVNWIAIA